VGEILIVGAGPTGLVLALYLAKQGIRARIIDKNTGPGLASRAMVLQVRTLEFYDQIGIAEKVIDSGFKLGSIHLREGDDEVATFQLTDMGKGLSPYPFALSFPQDDHEKLLGEELKKAGIEVEWNTELVSFEETPDGVQVRLNKNGTQEQTVVKYLCGCDGAHSTTRQLLKLGFPGGTYNQIFFVADVAAMGPAANADLNMCLNSDGFCLVFPIRSSGHFGLIGLVPPHLKSDADVRFENIKPFAEKIVGLQVTHTFWDSVYHVHHRVAEHFRIGRVFLAGDAGHVHSPVGGQGMNTGIGDAINLAWKLAEVVQGRADEAILDSYEPERISFAHALVQSTDRAFQAIIGQGWEPRMLRSLFIPHLAPFLFGFSGFRRAAFRLISQTRIHYRDSSLSKGKVGHLHAGDRLPWVEASNNFKPLKSLDWQMHIYGKASDGLRKALQQTNLALQEFEWTEDAEHAGLRRDGMYLIRPDGHIGLASQTQDVEVLGEYLDRFHLNPVSVGYSA